MLDLHFERVLSATEIKSLSVVASKVWHEYFPCILQSEQIDYMVEKFQSQAAITEQVSNGYTYYFIMYGKEIIGYMGIKPEAERLFLSKLYIIKEYRGRGFGSRAIEFLDDYCKINNLKSIYLTVNRHNKSTISVYLNNGFKTIEEKVADIGNGYVMDDYIMEKNFCPR